MANIKKFYELAGKAHLLHRLELNDDFIQALKDAVDNDASKDSYEDQYALMIAANNISREMIKFKRMLLKRGVDIENYL